MNRQIGKVESTSGATSKPTGPIEAKMKLELDRLRGCSYPDQFDWSVYDRIAARFEEPPRGGVVFNTTFRLQSWHSACAKCHYAFEIDTYGRGCFHDCVYCYAKDQLTTHGFWNRPQPFPINLAEVRKVFYQVFETDKRNKWREVMEKRVPLRIGSMSDSFMYMDAKIGVTKELLRILRYYRYPYIIFTRSDLIARNEYLSLLDRELGVIQFSISGNNQKLTRLLEPGAPSYRKRLLALELLVKEGFWTTVRINPLFPKYPDGFFSDPEYFAKRFGNRKQSPVFPLYDDNFIAEVSDVGVPSVLAGFVRICGKAVKNISESTSVDFRSFFRPELAPKSGNADGYYSDAEISHYYKWFRSECVKNEMRFSTCYIGNGEKDYYQYQSLWDNKDDCCDAVGNVSGFKSTCQSISKDCVAKFSPTRVRKRTMQQ